MSALRAPTLEGETRGEWGTRLAPGPRGEALSSAPLTGREYLPRGLRLCR